MKSLFYSSGFRVVGGRGGEVKRRRRLFFVCFFFLKGRGRSRPTAAGRRRRRGRGRDRTDRRPAAAGRRVSAGNGWRGTAPGRGTNRRPPDTSRVAASKKNNNKKQTKKRTKSVESRYPYLVHSALPQKAFGVSSDILARLLLDVESSVGLSLFPRLATVLGH